MRYLCVLFRAVNFVVVVVVVDVVIVVVDLGPGDRGIYCRNDVKRGEIEE